MNKKDVIEFFDCCAQSWDEEMIKNDDTINKILDNAKVEKDMDVLDVACGTGVLFDFYLKRGVSAVYGIDISPEMIKTASGKYMDDPTIHLICGDVEKYSFDRLFDRIVVYNALPHFQSPKRLINILSGLLNEDGRLTVAHGMSREAINEHHRGSARKVSNELISAEELKTVFEDYLEIETVISDDKMYQVSGLKRK